MTPEVAAYIVTVKNAYQLWMSNLAIKERVGIGRNRLMLYIQACFLSGYIKIIDRYYSKTNPDVDNFITKALMDILRDRIDRILRVPAVPAITYYGPLIFVYGATQCIFNFKINSGKPFIIDWGNGTNETIEGLGSSLIVVTSKYTSPGTYDIKFNCDINAVTYFDINNQNISGDISWILKWTSLSYIDLSYNPILTGIMTNLKNLTGLTHINLQRSYALTGSYTDWGSLINLEYLNLGRTDGMTGVVTTWNTMSSIEEIHMEPNVISSGVITGWTALWNLKIIDMPGCNLTGSCAWFLTYNDIEEVILYSNTITGDLGYGVSSHAHNLRYVDLSATSVTGSLTYWMNMTNLEYVNFYNVTGLVGGLQGLYNLSNLQHLIINASTAVSGTITNFVNLNNLEYLDLQTTAVIGSISNWYTGLEKLEYLDLNTTAITGDASRLYQLDFLETIILDDTDVTWDTVEGWGNYNDGWAAKNGIIVHCNNCTWLTEMVDDCLIGLSGGGGIDDVGITNSSIDIAGDNEARSIASDAAMLIHIDNNNDVIVNK